MLLMLKIVDAEDRRLSAIGNSFHTTTVALVLGSILFRMGFWDEVRGPDELLTLINEWKGTEYPTRMREPESEGSDNGREARLSEMEIDEALATTVHEQPDLDEVALNQQLMTRLVHLFLRKVECRGSDIRLDTNSIFKPDSCSRSSIDPSKWEWEHCRSFRWRKSEHINLLEMKAVLHCIQWR